jgi:hypothetical protein
MSHSPLVIGVSLCEDVVHDTETGNLSVIRLFTGIGGEPFPFNPPPFCVFASLTDGFGPTDIDLIVHEIGEGFPEIYRLRRRLNFTDRLQIVNFLMRLSRIVFPRPGAYTFTLESGGEWLAQRSLRVSSAAEEST